MQKKCTKCLEWKDETLEFFRFSKSLGRFLPECRTCRNSRKREDYKKNTLKQREIRLLERQAKLQKKERERQEKELRKNSSVSRKREYSKEWASARAEHCKAYRKIYYENNREYLCDQSRKYYHSNKSLIKESRTKRSRIYRSKPEVKLRYAISKYVLRSLGKVGKTKNNLSFLKFVDWTPSELKAHIEKLWEPWMDWNNHGRANISEKRWHIDHIIPQTALPYDSLEHPNFKKCWALSNLRPLEAIANLKKYNKII